MSSKPKPHWRIETDIPGEAPYELTGKVSHDEAVATARGFARWDGERKGVDVVTATVTDLKSGEKTTEVVKV